MKLHLYVRNLQLHTHSNGEDQYVNVTFNCRDTPDELYVTIPADKAPRVGQRFKLELTEEN